MEREKKKKKKKGGVGGGGRNWRVVVVFEHISLNIFEFEFLGYLR